MRLVRERAGKAFDPEVAACLSDHATEILALDEDTSVWEETLACQPHTPLLLEGEALDRGLAAIGNFADLISPCLTGHSAGVADLAAAAARRCRIDETGGLALRHAALIHDLGRVAVHARIWQKPGPLNADEWEQVRLHPYHSERVLARSEFLAALAPIAGAHDERLDGPGYHRGAAGAELALPARLLAAADAFHAMTEPPEPPGPPVFSMESAERTAALLEAAGFSAVRTEEVPVRSDIPGVEEYLTLISNTAGPLGLALRGLSRADRELVKADVDDSLARFAAAEGFELPGTALCAVAA